MMLGLLLYFNYIMYEYKFSDKTISELPFRNLKTCVGMLIKLHIRLGHSMQNKMY